ncbi:LORF2 protein, partial [Crocuta crocuta]
MAVKKKKKIVIHICNVKISKTIKHDQVELIPRMQRWFSFQKPLLVIQDINRLKKKIMITLIDAEKTLTKFNTYHEKNAQRNRNGTSSTQQRTSTKKPTAGILFNSKRLNTLSLRSGTREGFSFLPLLVNIML